MEKSKELLVHGSLKFNNWHAIYEDESKALRGILGENFIEAHHIGSTSIYNIYAKPNVDIALIVKDLCASKILVQYGYQMRGEFNIPFRYFYSKEGDTKVKLHVMLPGNHELDNFINFRDYLNNNESKRNQYSNIKLQIRDLLDQIDNKAMFNKYTLAKNDMIVQFIRESGFDKTCMRFVAHYSEQQYEKNICEKNGISINDSDTRVVLYKGADIIGYSIATDNTIRFITALEKINEFRDYFEKYLNYRVANVI